MIQSVIHKIRRNPYGFFFVKLFILLSILFILDFTIGGLLGKYYFKLNRGDYYRTTYSIDSTKADILIFGSSRANHHYSAGMIEKRLGMTCYNAGRDASSVFYHTAMLKGILKRYTPKIVILDLLNDEFMENQDSYDRITSLLPYYKAHPEIRSIVELKSPYEKYKLLSKIYPYNSLISIIASGTAMQKPKDDINGYIPLKKLWNEPIQNEVVATYLSDKNKISCYEDFMNDCKNSGIRLYVFVSPRFIKPGKDAYSVPLAQEMANKKQVEFYDYSRDTSFLSDVSLFADEVHLNVTGAEIFTNIVIDKIAKEK